MHDRGSVASDALAAIFRAAEEVGVGEANGRRSEEEGRAAAGQ
jgi:hypothetical protein